MYKYMYKYMYKSSELINLTGIFIGEKFIPILILQVLMNCGYRYLPYIPEVFLQHI